MTSPIEQRREKKARWMEGEREGESDREKYSASMENMKGEEEWRKLLREQDGGRGSSAHIEERGAHIRET